MQPRKNSSSASGANIPTSRMPITSEPALCPPSITSIIFWACISDCRSCSSMAGGSWMALFQAISVSIAGTASTSANRPHISILPSGRRSSISSVAGRRVTSIAVTRAGNINSTRSCMTARIRVDGTVIPNTLMTTPTSTEEMTKHRMVTSRNRPSRLGRLMVNRILYFLLWELWETWE